VTYVSKAGSASGYAAGVHQQSVASTCECQRPPQRKDASMTKDYKGRTQAVSGSLRKFRADMPEVMKGFNDLARSAMQDGVLDHKTKELIALCLGVAGHCDACIGFHIQALIKAGATKAEVEEALAVAVYMGGGPSLMYAADALIAFEQMLPVS
jgi:AhpD family alkylhydroperoxidase